MHVKNPEQHAATAAANPLKLAAKVAIRRHQPAHPAMWGLTRRPDAGRDFFFLSFFFEKKVLPLTATQRLLLTHRVRVSGSGSDKEPPLPSFL